MTLALVNDRSYDLLETRPASLVERGGSVPDPSPFLDINMRLTMLAMELMESNEKMRSDLDGCIIIHIVEGMDDLNAHNRRTAMVGHRESGKDVMELYWKTKTNKRGWKQLLSR